MKVPKGILRSSLSMDTISKLDPKEGALILDVFSDEFDCDWVSASGAAKVMVAAKTMVGEIFNKTTVGRNAR